MVRGRRGDITSAFPKGTHHSATAPRGGGTDECITDTQGDPSPTPLGNDHEPTWETGVADPRPVRQR
jgi:hypothetical protein